METIVIVVHILVALAIIGLILMQQGKGAEAGASFGGGASQTVFGSQGGGNFFSKATAVLAFVFFATSFSLAIIAKEKTDIPTDLGIPSAIEQQELDSEVPVISTPASESEVPVIEGQTPQVDSELPSVSSAEAVVAPIEAKVDAATDKLKEKVQTTVEDNLPAAVQDAAK